MKAIFLLESLIKFFFAESALPRIIHYLLKGFSDMSPLLLQNSPFDIHIHLMECTKLEYQNGGLCTWKKYFLIPSCLFYCWWGSFWRADQSWDISGGFWGHFPIVMFNQSAIKGDLLMRRVHFYSMVDFDFFWVKWKKGYCFLLLLLLIRERYFCSKSRKKDRD